MKPSRHRYSSSALPLRAETSDIVTDRHETYIASEVHRVLKPQGVFIIQQIADKNNTELHDFLQGETNSAAHSCWNLKKAIVELEAAGFHS
jgi:ubiquinone/menaquinone biosynthesis C-methylase UbiE